MKKQFGYTLTELLLVMGILVIGLLSLAVTGGLIYAGYHFISKWW
jgi:prepilin-type N-terminal cleavage/methylation domain-containing protein